MNQYVLPPRQRRSQQTGEAILNAVHRLLEKGELQEATIGQIVQEAGCSTGSFYGRFKDKQALLECVHERLCQRTDRFLGSFLEPARWSDATLSTVLKAYLRVLVKNTQKNRGVLRAALLWSNFSSGEFRDRSALLSHTLATLLAVHFERHRVEISHPEPGQAARVVSELIAGFLWRTVLAADTWQDWPEAAITRELRLAIHAYLGLPFPGAHEDLQETQHN